MTLFAEQPPKAMAPSIPGINNKNGIDQSGNLGMNFIIYPIIISTGVSTSALSEMYVIMSVSLSYLITSSMRLCALFVDAIASVYGWMVHLRAPLSEGYHHVTDAQYGQLRYLYILCPLLHCQLRALPLYWHSFYL